jgi:hypothetical protein
LLISWSFPLLTSIFHSFGFSFRAFNRGQG